MKHPDFDKAFAPTPEIVSLSIEDAFRKGERAMKLRYKITAALSAAAVLLVVFAAAVFALPNEPQPDVVSQPVMVEPTEEPVVYYTEKGVYYHNIEDCSGMLGAQPHGLMEAKSDGKIACPVCVEGKRKTWFDNEAEFMPTPSPIPATEEGFFGEVQEEIVYYTEYGKYRHFDEHCSGMMNANAHSLTEALRAGKEPCPVCYIPELPVDSEPQPADHMCLIGMEYFLEIFERGVMETFPEFDMMGTGKQTGDYLWEEATYTNDNGLYLAVYREMQNDTLMSGRIALMFPAGFDYDLFSSEGAAWYHNAYSMAMETLVSMPMNSHINKLSSTFSQIYLYFDSELKPSVCELEFETDGGFFTLSFDINGDEVSLATMNYNVSRA